MRSALAAFIAALGLAACSDNQSASYTPEPYPQQEARRDAQRLPPTDMPNPDETAPVTPRSAAPLDPTDPQALPPGSPPPVLPPTPPT